MPGDAAKSREQLLEELEAAQEQVAELRGAAERLQLLSRISESGVSAVIATDLEFRITYASPAFRRLYAYSEGELLGQLPDFLNAEPLSELIQQDIYRTVSAGEVWTGEALQRRGDGTTFHGELTVFPLRDDLGNTVAYAGRQRDITERKQAEEALRQQRDFAKSLLDTAQVAILVLDPEARVVSFNRYMEELSGYQLSEVAGRDWFTTFIAGEEREAIRALFLEAVSGTQTCGYVNPILTKDGRLVEIEWYDKTLLASDGSLIGLLAIGLDVSERLRQEEERRELEEKVRQAQKLESLGVLAGGIAHDFNNLLTVILGSTDLALMDIPAHSTARDHLEKTLKATTVAADLTNQMLAYSGRGKFVAQSLDLSALIRNVRSLLISAVSKKTELTLDLADDLPAVEGDATQLQQIVLNLVTNASEALGDRNGQVRVETRAVECDRAFLDSFQGGRDRPEGRYVLCEVSDTGCGIDTESLKKIFEPFFSTKFTGRGLGLSAVLGIASGHQGAVRVESAPGEGTTFQLLLPVCDVEAEANQEAVAPAEGWRGSGTILLAEDETLVREYAVAALETLGFCVLAALDGFEAVELFRQRHSEIVCVLLDFKMPRMDGGEAFVEIRRIRGDVPVLLASGFNEQDATAGLMSQGLAGFVPKPFRLAALRAKLREALAR
jgi:two-component system, cell cycle sensor histidine kinase and response regulator CckA